MQAMDEVQAAPSLSQAQRLKKLAQEGGFTIPSARISKRSSAEPPQPMN